VSPDLQVGTVREGVAVAGDTAHRVSGISEQLKGQLQSMSSGTGEFISRLRGEAAA